MSAVFLFSYRSVVFFVLVVRNVHQGMSWKIFLFQNVNTYYLLLLTSLFREK